MIGIPIEGMVAVQYGRHERRRTGVRIDGSNAGPGCKVGDAKHEVLAGGILRRFGGDGNVAVERVGLGKGKRDGRCGPGGMNPDP
jgi:hypothetical protein